jgi:hypothetical protein
MKANLKNSLLIEDAALVTMSQSTHASHNTAMMNVNISKDNDTKT